MSPHVVLIGAPGSGKSTVGALLAETIGREFFDSDVEIEKREQMSISNVFIEKSEKYFRSIEKSVVLELLTSTDGVVSLGGGSVLDEDVQKALRACTVVWLQVTLADAVQRVGLNQSRPLLLGNVRGNMKKLLADRNHIYKESATFTVDAANSPQAIVRSIVEKLKVN